MRTFAKAATLQVLPSLPLKFEGGRARTGNQSRAFELLGLMSVLPLIERDLLEA